MVRARIFTPYERKLLRRWLGLDDESWGDWERELGYEEAKKRWRSLKKLRKRIRKFKELREDVKLYILALIKMNRDNELEPLLWELEDLEDLEELEDPLALL